MPELALGSPAFETPSHRPTYGKTIGEIVHTSHTLDNRLMATALAAGSNDVATLQRYARIAGVAMLLTMIFGFLGEMYLPGRILVAGDPTATAANITGHPMLFR